MLKNLVVKNNSIIIPVNLNLSRCLFLFYSHVQQSHVNVVVNFLSQLIFIFPLFWGMVMYVNEF